jgi:DNA-binding transcriptional LysR family regulator
MRSVTIRQLQIFVEVADHLSLARVAERLRLTPSAISFQIGKIEEQTGFALLERIGRRVALTDAGHVLLAYARLMLQSLREADLALTALHDVDGGRVALGLVSTAKYIVPHMVARFRTQFPRVEVRLREGNRARVLEMLAAGQVDLVIMGQPPEGADVIAHRFADHPSVFIAPPGHALQHANGLAVSALADHAFVMREEGSGTRQLADQVFRAANFSPRVALVSSSNEMIKQAVIAGMGLAMISRHTISLEHALGLLVTLDVEDAKLMRAWFVVQRRTLPLLPVHARLRDFLVAEGEAVIDEINRGHLALASGARVRREKPRPPWKPTGRSGG